MQFGQLAFPVARSVFLAVLVTALIIFGYPAVLALGAAAGN